jgi:RNA polymerase subunit RPABC4/transcription elongation factor Spt4
MKYCVDCQAFLSSDKCPTCGGSARRKQSIFTSDAQESSAARRLSTIQEEDPSNDDVTRALDSDLGSTTTPN